MVLFSTSIPRFALSLLLTYLWGEVSGISHRPQLNCRTPTGLWGVGDGQDKGREDVALDSYLCFSWGSSALSSILCSVLGTISFQARSLANKQISKWRSLNTQWLKALLSWQSHHQIMELTICSHYFGLLLLCYKTIQNLAAQKDNNFIIFLDVLVQKCRQGLAEWFFSSMWHEGVHLVIFSSQVGLEGPQELHSQEA